MPEEPLRTTTFILTTADAMAYEALPRPFTGLGRLGFVVWLALAGVVAALLPADWTGGSAGLGFWVIGAILVVIQYTLLVIVLNIRIYRRARARIAQPREVTAEEWPDRLDLSGAGALHDIPYGGGTARLTPTHLFITVGNDLVILPRRAFSEDGSLEALAARFPPPAAVDPAAAAA